MYRKLLKRLIDFLLSLFAIVLLSPLYILLFLLVRFFIGKPVLFMQVRTTRNQRSFNLMKFRTMTDARDSNGDLLPDADRYVPFGRWLRNTSLDELPELINILKGDMSIIGPRPLYPIYNPYYKESEMDRFSVRGGLIPPEAFYGNPDPSWDEQLQCEAEYGRNVTFMFDVRIILKVFALIFKRSQAGYGENERKNLNVERAFYYNK